ncbi:hypothetical protein M9H77_03051 [Catharanthus roseus]|uniref:Uncharacterized protein n=1 Tax=Catharanthus roseus TaxID=4058 RepID=A0ACC0CAM2_CATRO|nr:hypothetical protein M9H77_03051 [Catharanthus roseus]
MVLHNSKLLQHANRGYTIGAYRLFERYSVRFPEFCQGLVFSNNGEYAYEIWRLDISWFKYTIIYNETLSISCTSKMFSEVGNLCCLHVLNIQCVQIIPDKYILERWTKNIALSWGSSGVGDSEKVNNKGNAGSSVWRMEMLRTFSYLISASELNVNARKWNERSSIIKDLIGNRVKGEGNVRKKSIVEIRCNQVKEKRKNALMCASRNKMAVQLSMNNEALGKVVNAPSSECQFSSDISSYSNVEQSSTLQPLINFL